MKQFWGVVVLAIVSSAATAQVPRSATFKAPLDVVWQSAIETVADSNFEVQSSDKASGAIWLKESKSVGGNSYANSLVRRYTTKKVTGFSNWEGFSISGSLTVKEQGGGTGVVCHFSYSGYNHFGGWEQLESNGSIEGAILTGISNRLQNMPVRGTAGNDDRPVGMATPPVPGAPSIGQAQLEVSSTPDGADIEIDGNFVGNTPSTLGIAAGQHRLVVRKNGLTSWEKMITVSTGLVRVNALLEAESKETANRNASQGASAEAQNARASLVASGLSAEGTERDEESSIGALFYGKPTIRHDGVEVSVVQRGGSAEEAGIGAGDVILSVDGNYVYTINDLHAELQSHSRDAKVGIKYRRGSLTYETSINLRSK